MKESISLPIDHQSINVEGMTELENKHLIYIIVITNSNNNHQWK